MKANQKKAIQTQCASTKYSACLPIREQADEMCKRYGDAKKFLETFMPELQTIVAREWVRAYTGTAPTLAVVAAGYGVITAIVWLCLQVENINLFANVKGKMEVKRQKELAAIILAEYPYLKVTELLLFFHRLKCGWYGRFYGTVDALFISSALLQFMGERRKDLTRIEEQQRKTRKEEETGSQGMSYDEYLAWKQKNRKNYEQ